MCKRWHAAAELLFPLRDAGGTGGDMADEVFIECLVRKLYIFSAVRCFFFFLSIPCHSSLYLNRF